MTEFSKIFLVFFKFMSERAVFVAFAEGLKYQSTVYRRGFRNPEDNTEKAYKIFSRYLVKVHVHDENFLFKQTEYEQTETLPVLL
jgi:hypothetical protein